MAVRRCPDGPPPVSSPEATSDHFDLLPFISILMCVLGCLLLVTISMSAISMGVGAAEVWSPQGLGSRGTVDPAKESGKIPVLVEWDGKVATFQFGKRRIPGEWTAANSSGDATFQGALRFAAVNKDSTYLLVAVRPSGFATLAPLLDVLRASGLEVGYEPVEQARPVSLELAKPPAAKPKSESKAQAPSEQEASSNDVFPTKDEQMATDERGSNP